MSTITFPPIRFVSEDGQAEIFPDDVLEKLRRMTLIVGAIGKNGIVLAADRNAINFAPMESEIDEMVDVGKIVHIERHSVVCAFAGDHVSQLVPEAIEAILDHPGSAFFANIKSNLQIAANKGFELYDKKTNRSWTTLKPTGRQLFVALYGANVGDSPQLWAIDVICNGCSNARQIKYKLELAGAKGNGGGFFRVYWKPGLSIDKVTEIAAHIILAANKCDPLIEGLDIVKITKESGFHELTKEEKDAISDRYQELDGTMTRLFN
jgi:20S proteasome alpha/beta subunit